MFLRSLLSLAFASLCFGLTDRSTDRISGEKRLHRRIQLLYGDLPGPNQALGNCLFDTPNVLRDAALAALDSINPPNLFTYSCPEYQYTIFHSYPRLFNILYSYLLMRRRNMAERNYCPECEMMTKNKISNPGSNGTHHCAVCGETVSK